MDDQTPTPAVSPFVRQPLIPALLPIVPAIIIGALLPAPMGLFIAAVVFIGQSVTLYRIFDKTRKKMVAEHPGIFDRPAASTISGATGPTAGPVQDPPQGPIIS